MKRLVFALLCAVATVGASAQDGKLTVNAGFLFPSTLNATVGYEHPLAYGNAVKVFGEVGNHWRKPDFWKGYYWDGGIVYKHRLARYKNGMLRFRFGPQFGAVERKFFLGLEGGFEYSYVFRNGLEFSPRYIFLGSQQMLDDCRSLSMMNGLDAQFVLADAQTMPDGHLSVSVQAMLQGMGKSVVNIVYDADSYDYQRIFGLFMQQPQRQWRIGTYHAATHKIVTDRDVIS